MATLTDAHGHTVEIFVKSENESIDSNVSTHPIETGSPITDHAQRESKTHTFSGLIYGNDQSQVDARYNQLMYWQSGGDLLQFRGAIRHNDLLISHLEKTYDEGGKRNAVSFNITLTTVTLVNLKWDKATNTGKKQAAPPVDPGVYVTVVAGDTYWGWWVKYGTSIDQLRAWNNWNDYLIPIGARARVK